MTSMIPKQGEGSKDLRRVLAQREAELALINSIQQALASRLDVQAIYDLVGDKIRQIFDAQVVMISTYDPLTDTMEHRYAIEQGERVYALGRFPIRGFRIEIVETHKPVLISTDVAEEAERLGQPTLPGTITPKTWLGVPMMVGDQVKGILSLQNIEQEYAFSDSDVRLLQTLAASMSVALENARLWEQEKKYLNALAHELEIGREIQAGFLPKDIPQPAGWEIAARLIPAREVAGDFYDVFELPNHQIGLVIADVCDKGVGAALFMTLFRSFIRAVSNLNVYSRTNEEPARSPSERLRSTISLTNNYISETHGNTGMFATLFFGILDTTTGVMTYINGGHLPPILFNKSGIKHVFSLTGPGVGAISDADYSIREVSLEREDMFFACTDGLTEIEGAVSDFSYEKIIRTLSLQEISLDNSLSKIQVFYGFQASSMQQMDDCTMLACRRL